MRDSLSQAAEEQKHSVSTATNVAYGCVEFGDTDFEISGMPSGASMTVQEPISETVSM